MTASQAGIDNLRRRVQATREPGRTIRRRRRKKMPWHQEVAQFVVLVLMWMVALVWLILPPR